MTSRAARGLVQVDAARDDRKYQLTLGVVLERTVEFRMTAPTEDDEVCGTFMAQVYIGAVVDMEIVRPTAKGALPVRALFGVLGDLSPMRRCEILGVVHLSLLSWARACDYARANLLHADSSNPNFQFTRYLNARF